MKTRYVIILLDQDIRKSNFLMKNFIFLWKEKIFMKKFFPFRYFFQRIFWILQKYSENLYVINFCVKIILTKNMICFFLEFVKFSWSKMVGSKF